MTQPPTQVSTPGSTTSVMDALLATVPAKLATGMALEDMEVELQSLPPTSVHSQPTNTSNSMMV